MNKIRSLIRQLMIKSFKLTDNQFDSVDSDNLKKAYQALDEKFKELQAAEEELAASYEELQSAEEELNQQNEQLRNTKEVLQQSEILLKESQRVARIGHYVFNIATSYWESSETLDDVFGIDQHYTKDINGWLQIIHPAHQQCMLDYLTNHVLTNKQPFDIEYRVIRVSDKQERWVHGLGNLKLNAQGQPIEMFGVIQDITERKQAENELFENKERLHFALEGTNDGIWDVQMKTGSVYISPRGCEILGYGKEGLSEVVKVWSDLVNPDDLLLTNERLQAHLEGKTSIFEVEQRLRMKSGEWKWILTRGKVVSRDIDGSALRMTGTHTDITARKLAEEALQESEKRFQLLFNKAPLGYQSLDFDGYFIEINQQWLDTLGYTREEVIGKWFGDFLSPAYQDGFRERFPIFKAQGKIHSEFEMVHKNGKKLFMAFEGKIGYDLNGEFKQTHCILQDITERKQTERALRESQSLYYSFLEQLPNAVFRKDLEGRYVLVNAQFCRLKGLKKEDVIGKKPMEVAASEIAIQGEQGQATKYANVGEDVHELILQTGKTFETEEEYPAKDGGKQCMQIMRMPVFDSYGTIIGTQGIMFDVTQSKQAEFLLKEKSEEIETQNEELQQTIKELYIAKEKAQESDRLKTVFLQNMSHEIRTPMNAIMGFSDLLSENFDNKAKLENFANIIKQRSSDLLDLINEILDLSKIETGQLPINNEECNLDNLFKELHLFFTNHRQKIGKTHIDLQFTTNCDLQQMLVRTDKGKLKQIFINLIYNAFKFTDKGNIKFGSTIENNNNMMFFVSDTGIGIPEDKQTTVFERFMQLDTENRNALGGTGLGLSIVKGLVELLGGEIKLKSVVGEGSTFYFSVPYQKLETEQIKTTKPFLEKHVNWKSYTLLIIEDDKYNTEYLKEVLSETEINILATNNAKQAIELIESGQIIDIILMDIKMPGMNGLEASFIIKSKKPQMKIIAQTAYATQSDKENAINAGCADYIAKPINKELLITTISEQLNSEK